MLIIMQQFPNLPNHWPSSSSVWLIWISCCASLSGLAPNHIYGKPPYLLKSAECLFILASGGHVGTLLKA